MALNVASLNARGLRDASKSAQLLSDLSNLCVNVAAVQETHFIFEAAYWVLKDDFVVYSAFGSHLSTGVSLLVGRSLDAIVNVLFAGDGGRLLVADVAVKTFEFRIAYRFMCPMLLQRDALSFGGWSRSWMPRSGQF